MDMPLEPTPEELEAIQCQKEEYWKAESVVRLRTMALTRQEMDDLCFHCSRGDSRFGMLAFFGKPEKITPAGWEQLEWWYYELVENAEPPYLPGDVVKPSEPLFSLCKVLMHRDRLTMEGLPMCHCCNEGYFMPAGCRHAATLGDGDGEPQLPNPRRCLQCCKCMRCNK